MVHVGSKNHIIERDKIKQREYPFSDSLFVDIEYRVTLYFDSPF